jgi:hypothetical protein
VRVTVLHHVNGATKTAVLEAPHVSTVMTADGGVHIELTDVIGGPFTGFAMFTAAGLVALNGVAVEQYGFIEKED